MQPRHVIGCAATLLVACFGGGASGGGGAASGGMAGSGGTGAPATTDEARVAQAESAIDGLSEEAVALATAYDEQVSRAQSEATFDVEDAIAFLDDAPIRLEAMAGQLESLEQLVAESGASEVGMTSAALHTGGPDCESGSGSGFWAHVRSFFSNLAGGPVPADNLYTAADDANRIRDSFKGKWQARIDACNKIANVSERNLCIARVSDESRLDFAQSASELGGPSGAFIVIKALGAGVIGIGIGAGAAALSFTGGWVLVLGAGGAVLAEDVIDTLFRPVSPDGTTAPEAAVVARVPASSTGTQIPLPAGRYEMLTRQKGKASTLRVVTVSEGATSMAPVDCSGDADAGTPDAGSADASIADAAVVDAGSNDAGGPCPAGFVLNPENGLCVCPPQQMTYDGVCRPFTCTDAPYDSFTNSCACPNSIPTVTEQDGMLLVTCSGF